MAGLEPPALLPAALFAALALLNLARWLIARQSSSYLSLRRQQLARSIASLRRQASAKSSPGEFAQAALKQRKANALEKELEALVKEGAAGAQDRVASLVGGLKAALVLSAVVAMWGKALLHVPPHLTWPFSRLLAFPHASNYLEVGAVTVLPWISVCDRVSAVLARTLFPERALPLSTAPLPPVLEEPELSGVLS